MSCKKLNKKKYKKFEEIIYNGKKVHIYVNFEKVKEYFDRKRVTNKFKEYLLNWIKYELCKFNKNDHLIGVVQ